MQSDSKSNVASPTRIIDIAMASEFRCVLEVLRFLPTENTLLAASVLSRTWHKAADSEELWRNYCELANIEIQVSVRIPLKFQYMKKCCAQSLLPIVKGVGLLLYAVPSLEAKTVILNRRVSADIFTSYCFLNWNTLMASGAYAYTSEAYKICIDTGLVTSLSPMSVARHSAPLRKYHRRVYCFGGYSRHHRLTLIERYDIEANAWTNAPNSLTSSRSGMIPTRYRSLLYIPGSGDIDVFNLETEEVSLFPLRLPQDWHYCLAHVTAEGELVVVQKDKVLRCSVLHSPDHFDKLPMKMKGNGIYWSNCPVVKVGSVLFSLHNSHGKIEGVLQFDLEMNQLR